MRRTRSACWRRATRRCSGEKRLGGCPVCTYTLPTCKIIQTHPHPFPNLSNRLEAEKDYIAKQTVSMRERMRTGFCATKAKSTPIHSFSAKSASLPVAEPGTGRLKRRKMSVDVLAEDGHVAVLHLKGFLDKNMTRSLLLNAPSVGEGHVGLTPAVGFAPDAEIAEIARWAEDFVAGFLAGDAGQQHQGDQELPKERRPSVALGMEAVVQGEPLLFFRHDDHGVHA